MFFRESAALPGVVEETPNFRFVRHNALQKIQI